MNRRQIIALAVASALARFFPVPRSEWAKAQPRWVQLTWSGPLDRATLMKDLIPQLRVTNHRAWHSWLV